ncbi:MAG TPA: hypothetical protein VFR36_06540 [Sphingomicrobium sp.]|nr:hypothetical protein [Sphingomicrobium sp.]
MRALILPVLSLSLSGCIVASVAETAVDVVTLPVDVASKGVDLATTSQSEADEKRGREMRKAEEKAGKEARAREKRCREGQPLPTDDCTAILRN